MQRNTILYILIALLVVVGGTWYALSTQSIDEEREEDRTEEEQDEDQNIPGDDEDDASDDEEADGDSVSVEDGDTDTGTGTSADEAAPEPSRGSETGSQGSTSQGSGGFQGGESSVGGKGGSTDVVSGSRLTPTERETIEAEFQIQLEILSTVISVVELQLDAGEITVDEAAEILAQAGNAADELEESVELYLAL